MDSINDSPERDLSSQSSDFFRNLEVSEGIQLEKVIIPKYPEPSPRYQIMFKAYSSENTVKVIRRAPYSPITLPELSKIKDSAETNLNIGHFSFENSSRNCTNAKKLPNRRGRNQLSSIHLTKQIFREYDNGKGMTALFTNKKRRKAREINTYLQIRYRKVADRFHNEFTSKNRRTNDILSKSGLPPLRNPVKLLK